MSTQSSSLVFYNSAKGYILCKEDRIVDKNRETKEIRREVQSHLPGGKIESGETPILAAIREFCEEIVDSSFSRSLKGKRFLNSFYKCVKKAEIMKTFNLQVNKAMINPVFIIDIDQFRNIEDKDVYNADIYNFLDNVVENFSPRGHMRSLFYWSLNENVENPSYLLEMFISSMNPKIEEADDNEDDNEESKSEVGEIISSVAKTRITEDINLEDF